MARRTQSGWELNDTADAGSLSLGKNGEPSINTGLCTIQTGVVRSGRYAAQCDSGAGSAAASWTFSLSHTPPTTGSFRLYYQFADLPASTVRILDGTAFSVRLTSSGKLQLMDNTGTQQGSDSTETIATDGTWHIIEVQYGVNASSQYTGTIELRLNGNTVATFTPGGATAVPGFIGGWVDAPGASKSLYLDDFAQNDGSGTSQTSWAGDGKLVLLVPTADSAVGTGWTTSGGAATGLWDNVDNRPSTGIADTTGNAGHQIRNASSAASSYDAAVAAYATAVASGGGGISAGDTINCIQPICCVAAPVVTGAKAGSLGVASNPTIANVAFVNGTSAAANFWSGTAAGTYPTGWHWERGTMTYSPTVTLATTPAVRVSITGGTASRIALCSAMFLYVDYTPAAVAPPASLVVDTRRGSRNNPLLRRMQALPWNRRPSGILVPDRRILLPQPVI